MSNWLDDFFASLRVRASGALQTRRGSVNFAGAGVVVTDDPSNDATTVTISGGGSTILPATATPLVESGAGAVGTSVKYAKEDHVHPAYGGGGGAAGIDYKIDFTSQTRNYLTGTGAGSGSAGDNAQTVAFTITALNGTVVPSTLASGLTITPVSSANATILECGSNGFRGQITSGSAGKLTDAKFSLTQLGIDRSRPFSIWLLLNRTQVVIPSASEAGMVLMGNFVAGTPKVLLYSEFSAFATNLRSNVVGQVNGTYTAAQISTGADATDDIKVSRFGTTWGELYTGASVASAFPTSSSVASYGRRGHATVDALLAAIGADRLYVFPNDDDELRFRVRADSTNCTAAFYQMRVVQAGG